MITDLAEMGRQQPPTPVSTDNTAATRIVNGTAKQKRSRVIDMIFYWVRDRIRQNHFHISWEEGKNNLADYVTKHHPIWNHRKMRPRYINQHQKTPKTQNNGELRLEEGVLKLSIPAEPGNQTIPLRESGVQFPGDQIIPLRESGI